ncbi:MAG TPA: DUF2341 domain-containing protein [archaeon]|nr:DUF2341 domain-containing protein [archaeon]
MNKCKSNIIKLTILFLFTISIFSFPTHAADDDLTQWNLRKQINIENPFFYSPTDVTANFSQNTAELISSNKMKSDCSDIRIVNNEKEIVPYYVQGCNSTDTIVWFKIGNLSVAQGNSLAFWMYYNNSVALDKMNSNVTFLWADTENFEVGLDKKWVIRNGFSPVTGGPTNAVSKYGNQSMQVTTNGADSLVEIANLSAALNLNVHDNATIILYFQRNPGNSFQMVEFLTELGNDGIGFGTKNDQLTTNYAVQTFNVGYQDTGINFLDSDTSPTFIKLEANINSSGTFILVNDSKNFNFHKPQTGYNATQKFSGISIFVYPTSGNQTIYVDEVIVKKYFNGSFPGILIFNEESIKMDTIPPKIIILTANNTNFSTVNPSFAFNVTDNAATSKINVTLFIDGIFNGTTQLINNNTNGTINAASVSNGLHYAMIQVIDPAGNSANLSDVIWFKVDISIPSACNCTNLTKEIDKLKQKVGDLEIKVNNSENKIINLESRLDNTENKLSDMENELAATNNKLDILENNINSTTNSLEELKSKVDVIFGYLKNLLLPLKKEMICGYMKDNKLQKHEALGLKCNISRSNCICSIV